LLRQRSGSALPLEGLPASLTLRFCPAWSSPHLLPKQHFSARQKLCLHGSSSYSTSAGAIKDVKDVKDFQALAEDSKKSPIILDFYADWCGPCKQLSPKLEKAAQTSQGAFQVRKVDVESPALAPIVQHLKIQSLPTLMVLHDGQIVANSIIIGLPDDQKLAAYVDMIRGLKKGAGEGEEGEEGEGGAEKSAKEVLSSHFELLKSAAAPGGDATEAEAAVKETAAAFASVLGRQDSDDEDKARAKVGLAACALQEGNTAMAKELLRAVEAECSEGGLKIAELAAVKAQVEFSDGKEDLGEVEALLKESPGDLEAMHRYAVALFAEGRTEDALEAALNLVKKDKEWNEQAGRKLMVKFFDALGAESEVAASYRKRLSNLWFL